MLRGTYSYNSFKPLGLPLGVKARVNKLNFFGLDIVASKEYCLTIIVQRLLINTLLLAAPAVL